MASGYFLLPSTFFPRISDSKFVCLYRRYNSHCDKTADRRSGSPSERRSFGLQHRNQQKPVILRFSLKLIDFCDILHGGTC